MRVVEGARKDAIGEQVEARPCVAEGEGEEDAARGWRSLDMRRIVTGWISDAVWWQEIERWWYCCERTRVFEVDEDKIELQYGGFFLAPGHVLALQQRKAGTESRKLLF